MEPQYLDWYFVYLTYELEASRDRVSVGRQADMLSDAREKSPPPSAGNLGAQRNLPVWLRRNPAIQLANDKEYTEGDWL